MPKIIVVAGPPGSGKNTQAGYISEILGFAHFDTGDTLRRMKQEGLLTDDNMDKGVLTDPLVAREIFKKEIKKLTNDGPKGVVITGTLRTREESFGEGGMIEWFEQNYSKENLTFFVIDISPEESVKRNSIRNEGRADDLPEVIKVRLQEYQNRTKPVFDQLEQMGYKVIRIDGAPSREEVFADIKQHLAFLRLSTDN